MLLLYPSSILLDFKLSVVMKYHLRYADDTTVMAESEEELKSLLMKVKEESLKSWLITQHTKD